MTENSAHDNEEFAGDQDAGPASRPTGAAGQDTAQDTGQENPGEEQDQDAGPASVPEEPAD